MTNYEIPLITAIDNVLLTGKKMHDYYIENHGSYVKCNVIKKESVGNFEFWYNRSKNYLRFIFSYKKDSQSKLICYQPIFLKIPETEEEHFQLSTIKEMWFSYDFYEYLKNKLNMY